MWRKNENEVTKTFIKKNKVVSIQLDPMRETADINESNNLWKIKAAPSKFTLFKEKNNAGKARGQSSGQNPMQKAQGK